jgi:hypothetical protein
MFTEFESLPDSARVWVYQATRKLSETEMHTISQSLSAFTQQWAAHGQPLKSSFKIFHHQFIVLAADEAYHEASGCSIDDSVRVIREIDQRHNLGLFDRTTVAFQNEGSVFVLALTDLGRGLEEGVWNQHTQVFNNVIHTKKALSDGWIVPAHATWLKRYLAKTVV